MAFPDASQPHLPEFKLNYRTETEHTLISIKLETMS